MQSFNVAMISSPSDPRLSIQPWLWILSFGEAEDIHICAIAAKEVSARAE